MYREKPLSCLGFGARLYKDWQKAFRVCCREAKNGVKSTAIMNDKLVLFTNISCNNF